MNDLSLIFHLNRLNLILIFVIKSFMSLSFFEMCLRLLYYFILMMIIRFMPNIFGNCLITLLIFYGLGYLLDLLFYLIILFVFGFFGSLSSKCGPLE